MIKETIAIHEQHCATYPLKRICWSAIFVGALVGVGLSFLLNLFGIAIGLSAVTVSESGGIALAVGGVVGIGIAVIISMLLAGYAAGYLGRKYAPRRNLGILYGFATWTVALLFSATITSSLSHYASSYSRAVMHTTIVMQQDARDDVRPAKATSDQSEVTAADVTATTKSLAYGAFTLFVLFFIGAISACVGACLGMSCDRDD